MFLVRSILAILGCKKKCNPDIGRPTIYTSHSGDGWCKLQELADMLGCSQADTLHRFGVLCRDSHYMVFAYFRNKDFITFHAHWSSLVVTNCRAYAGNPPNARSTRVRGQLYVPAGWVEDVCSAKANEAYYAKYSRLPDQKPPITFFNFAGCAMENPSK